MLTRFPEATAASLKPNGFPPERRLRTRTDFERVYTQGRSWSNPVLAVRVCAPGLGRVGFAVGKRVGNAVVRNRVKRRLRDAIRRLRLRQDVDMVIIARGAAVNASYGDLSDVLLQVLRRAGATIGTER